MKKAHEEILTFLIKAGKLKREARRGWVTKAGVIRAESVADHTFRTALASMVLGDYLGLDTCRMVRMALVHDLPEAVTGDTLPEEKRGKAKKVEERKAFEALISSLEPKVRKLYREIWEEFQSQSSRAAKLVKEIDGLEMAIQAFDYGNSGVNPGLLRPFLDSAMRKIKEPTLVSVVKSVSDSFHKLGRRR